ncbi:MAG: hypothetical protein RSF40_01340 [Oscillospiraceae bacterium]
MYIKEWDNLPKNKYMTLLHKCGGEVVTLHNNITNIIVTVYNSNTDRVSDKSAYKDKEGRLYIKCRKNGYGKTELLFLDDFE